MKKPKLQLLFLIFILFSSCRGADDILSAQPEETPVRILISEVFSGVDGNTVSITNTRPKKGADGTADVLIQGLEAGWLDRSAIPQPEIAVPERGTISATITRDGLTLAQGTAGGFSVAMEGGPELLVETAIGMDRETPSALLAQDGEAEGVVVSCGPWTERGFRMVAKFPSFELTRTMRVSGGLVEWSEEWTNTTNEITGLPFRHRLFLRGETARFTLAGDTDANALAGCAANPTVFAESERRTGEGVGVTAESDWLRLLMYVRGEAGVGEVYSECLALPPGGSIRFDLTITPVADGGYWSFINSVRRRWGVNGTTMERPLFWGYYRVEGEDREDVVRKSLGHLGPIYVTVGGWMRLTADARLARGGAYPKLPEGAPPTPGESPDLDLSAFLRFEHRDAWWAAIAESNDLIRRVCPDARVINITHPAMEVVYQPLADRFPIAGQVIRTASGTPFHVHHYDVAHLGAAVEKDWAVYYYTPRPGSAYLQSLIADCRRSMDEAGSDGVYVVQRGNTLFSIARWNGVTVAALMAANGLRSYTIYSGQRLTIPNGDGTPSAPPAPVIAYGEKWIDVNLTTQSLVAYEGQRPVYWATVSTGRARTPTPTGRYRIYKKLRSTTMSGPGYRFRDVPHVMYFHGNYTLHGTYWHSNFGRPMSHGCVNLRLADAQWLYEWAPVGTLVVIHR